MNPTEWTSKLVKVSEILKRRFPNLTVSETIKIASEILETIDAKTN